ncbi:hypothetical protein [uncultured Prevotella sp.]|mgnify:FL=1|uniref:hypothetical protein n=1 Tax=uncultured Prevotella sp. TaxID=159272 RepID=UPI0027E295B1|nr:hypothetical protein [uncultured Prevotella sp.]
MLTRFIDKFIQRVAFVIMLCMMMAACSDSDDDAVGTEDVSVAFTLTVADATSTRAENDGWDDYSPAQDGILNENMVNTDDIIIAIYDDKGNKVDNVEDLRVTKISDASGTGTMYAITGVWRNAKPNVERAKRLMVMANCNTSVWSDPSKLTYDLLPEERKYIPMWGVVKIPAALTLGKQNKLHNIRMLRAMAKVSVKLRDDMTDYGYAIGSMTVNNYNTKGYCVPKTFNEVDNTSDVRFANSLNVLDSHADKIELPTTAPLYLPEYDNSGTNPATITVNLNRNGKLEGTYTLYFRNYDSDGKPTGPTYPIQRNHYYQYLIYKETGKIIVTLHVRKWNRRIYPENDGIIM